MDTNGKLIYDVDLAADIKNLIIWNNDVSFDDLKLRDKIFNLDDTVLVRIGKNISSLKIVSVDVIDVDFLKKIFGD